jgi:uncharacterized protein (DUF983 family)
VVDWPVSWLPARAPADVRLLRLLRAMHPAHPPIHRSRNIAVARLPELAQQAFADVGTAPAVVEELDRYGLLRLLARGAARRCPVCGGGRLFRRWFTIVDNCPRCGFRLERIEGHWIGALGINVVVSFGAVLVAVVVAFVATYPDGSAGAAVAVIVAVAVVVPLAFYPVSKTVWCAIDLAMRPLEPDDEVDPRWIPPATRLER